MQVFGSGRRSSLEARFGPRALMICQGLLGLRAVRLGREGQPRRSNNSQVQAKMINTPNATAPSSGIETSTTIAEPRGRNISDRARPQVRIPLAARARLMINTRFLQ